MYVEEIKHERNGKTYRTVLVRESYRDGKKVLHRTVSNISNLPKNCIQQIKTVHPKNWGRKSIAFILLTGTPAYEGDIVLT